VIVLPPPSFVPVDVTQTDAAGLRRIAGTRFRCSADVSQIFPDAATNDMMTPTGSQFFVTHMKTHSVCFSSSSCSRSGSSPKAVMSS